MRAGLRPVSPEGEKLVRNLADAAESFPSIEGADLNPLMERIRNRVGGGIISRTNPPQQFDEYVWFDETRAETPLDTAEIKGLPDTYPFGVGSRTSTRGHDLPIESSWVYEFEA